MGAHGRARERDEIRALKSETGGDIVTTGSIRLVRELIAAGLVDEYRLFTYPVVLGRPWARRPPVSQKREHRKTERYAVEHAPDVP